MDAEDYIIKKGGGSYDKDRYRSHPEEFESDFHTKIAPYTSVLINGIFWNARFPRLLSKIQTRDLAQQNQLKMLTIADISCDIEGSLEFMSHATTVDNPFFMYDPINCKNHNRYRSFRYFDLATRKEAFK